MGAGIAFALLNLAVARRDTASVDRKLEKKLKVPRGHALRRAAEVVAPLGKWWSYLPLAGGIAVYVVVAGREEEGRRRQSLTGGASIVGAALIAAVLNDVLDDVLPQPPAPPGRPSRTHPVFPSGHTFGTASVGLTAAWIISREELIHPSIAFPIAVTLPLISAGGRMMEDKHWVSDIAGGFLAALVVASLSIAVYEATAID